MEQEEAGTYTTQFASPGTHEVVAQFTGSSLFAASSGSSLVTIAVNNSGKGSFTLTANPTTLTVAQGSSGTETITATPASGYSGTVNLTVDFGSADSSLQNLCGGFGNGETSQGSIAITGTSPGSTTLLLDTHASDCSTTAAIARTGLHPLKTMMKGANIAKNDGGSKAPARLPAAMALGGLAFIGYFGRRSRKLRGLAVVLMLAVAGFALSACGGSSSTNSNPPQGTYTGTITGQDSASTITNSATFTFVIN